MFMRFLFSAALLCAPVFASENSKNLEKKIEIYDYVVVGAGLAGLTIACQLKKRDTNFILIEGKDRLGGRSYTHTFEDDGHVELGGETIDYNHHEIIELAKKLDVELVKKPLYEKVVFFDDDSKEISFGEVVDGLLEFPIEKIIEKLGKDEIHANLEEILEENFENKNFASILSLIIEDDYGTSPKNIGPYGIIYKVKRLIGENYAYLKLLKNNEKDIITNLNKKRAPYIVKGGNDKLIQALADKIGREKILQKKVLKKLSKENENFILEFKDKSILKAKKVVLTIPFSAMRNNQVILDESLGLPDLTKDAIEKLPYGMNSKLIYPVTGKPFGVTTYYGANLKGQFTFWNPSVGQKEQYITLTLGGNRAKDLFSGVTTLKKGDEIFQESIKSMGMEIDKKRFDGLDDKPLTHCWALDPFSKGSYSDSNFMGDNDFYKESTFKGYREFSDHVKGLFFAGEHTQINSATMNSAVRSGEQLFNRVDF